MQRMALLLLLFFILSNFSLADGHIVIKVAILDSAIPGMASPEEMMKILDGYVWEGDNKTYEFRAEWITDFEISTGKLNEFDVLIIPGIAKGYTHFLGESSLSKWKNEIKKFIYSGGGYFGTCGGANMAAMGLLSPEERGWKQWTAWEWFMNKAALKIAPVKAYQDMADPIACSIIWKNPFRLGQSAYIWYNFSADGAGVCQNCRVNRQHPVFNEYEKEERLIRWTGGPALIPVGNVSILVWYPDENVSGVKGNESTSIHAWKFKFDLANMDFWDMEEELIETHLASKPAAIACSYGKGRVIIFGNHPEYSVWKDGRIYEIEGKNFRFLGLFHWRDRQMLPPSYNWWIVRRSVAWVAGIDELPPIE